MAQKNSRTKKRPEMRTGGGRTAKSKRSEQRETHASAQLGAQKPLVKVRPAGFFGYTYLLVLSWLGVAAVVLAGYALHRWYVVEYPDSLWLYTSFGTVCVAPILGSYARKQSDVLSWFLQSLLVPLGMFFAEVFMGPACPTGGNCASVGARGSLGITFSILLVLAFAITAGLLAYWRFNSALNTRIHNGRVKLSYITPRLITALVLIGTPIAGVFIGMDYLMRSTPSLVQRASTDVASFCFPLGDAPDLIVRSSPDGLLPNWTSFAVRVKNDKRPGVSGKSLPSNWAQLDYLYPYEAFVSYDSRDLVSLNCRMVDPASGSANADYLRANEPSNNPLDPQNTGASFLPKFYTQGPGGATASGNTPEANDLAKKLNASIKTTPSKSKSKK